MAGHLLLLMVLEKAQMEWNNGGNNDGNFADLTGCLTWRTKSLPLSLSSQLAS